jgi:sugar/nucleoside kinase (ribokinase family)
MRISGVGCCLIDSIYKNCSYNDSNFSPYWSKTKGDGGLIEGGLVFREDLEKFAGEQYHKILDSITQGRKADFINVGGPAIIALVHASQILFNDDVEINFLGALGNDEFAAIAKTTLETTGLKTSFRTIESVPTSTTDVFSDPTSRNGKGERTFVNTIGAAGYFNSSHLSDYFYKSDIVLLGGTALVPQIHSDIDSILKRAKETGAITVVGTVYDFANEKIDPNKPWSLGKNPAYPYIDLLITDEIEALRLSGRQTITEAASALGSYGVGSLIITRGAHDILFWSRGKLFGDHDLKSFHVNTEIDVLMEADSLLRKDTTGCGDNFVGGVLVSLVRQLSSSVDDNILDIFDVCAWGVSSGGFACTYNGGMYHEKMTGEKAALIEPLVHTYKENYGVT